MGIRPTRVEHANFVFHIVFVQAHLEFYLVGCIKQVDIMCCYYSKKNLIQWRVAGYCIVDNDNANWEVQLTEEAVVAARPTRVDLLHQVKQEIRQYWR